MQKRDMLAIIDKTKEKLPLKQKLYLGKVEE